MVRLKPPVAVAAPAAAAAQKPLKKIVRLGLLGILNITPDSFSDGGQYLSPSDALTQADRLIADGATIIDIGGESSRPGAQPVTIDEEWARIGPVVEALAPRFAVSVDTTKAEIARRAMGAGARVINDISAGRSDPNMLQTVASGRATFIAMHMRGLPETMQRDYHPYVDLIGEVRTFLEERLNAAKRAGIAEVWIDPGIGFGKNAADNWQVLANLSAFANLAPLVVGCSRKSFLKTTAGPGASLAELDEWSAAAGLAALLAGASYLRVHAPGAHRKSLVVAKNLEKSG